MVNAAHGTPVDIAFLVEVLVPSASVSVKISEETGIAIPRHCAALLGSAALRIS